MTNAAAHLSRTQRRRVAEQLVEALVAYPLFSAQEDVIFHGDPHAGNLLYNNRSGELTIIDWALRERLSRDQRRHLALLFAMLSLRDPVGAYTEVLALTERQIRDASPKGQMLANTVANFIDELPVTYLPGMVDVMRLLERVAVMGVKFPGSLIMLSKVMFTLDGILRDIAGPDTAMGAPVARHLAQHWVRDRKAFRSPLRAKDLITLQCSAMLFTTRLWMRCEQSILDRLLPTPSGASQASA